MKKISLMILSISILASAQSAFSSEKVSIYCSGVAHRLGDGDTKIVPSYNIVDIGESVKLKSIPLESMSSGTNGNMLKMSDTNVELSAYVKKNSDGTLSHYIESTLVETRYKNGKDLKKEEIIANSSVITSDKKITVSLANTKVLNKIRNNKGYYRAIANNTYGSLIDSMIQNRELRKYDLSSVTINCVME